MKIIADENIPCVEQAFASLGEVSLLPGRGLQAGQVRDADILLVRSVTRVDASLLQGSSVRFVGSATIGFDHVDCDYLQRQQIGFDARIIQQRVSLCRRSVSRHAPSVPLLLDQEHQEAVNGEDDPQNMGQRGERHGLRVYGVRPAL